MKNALALLLMLMFALAACSGAQAVCSFSKGEEYAAYPFAESGTFEEGIYSGAANLLIEDGAYRIEVLQGDNTLWWGQWGATYADVIVEADVQQMTEPNQNAFGLMCRVRGTVGQPAAANPELAAILADPTAEATVEATLEATAEVTAEATAVATAEATIEPEVLPADPRNEGDGYLFLIQGGGQFSIMRARGRNLTPLVNWTASDAIKQGMQTNTLRAVCVGNYLAFYVNGTFVGEATDDTYRDGQVGLAASAADRLGTIIQFDNLTVSQPVAG